MFAPFKQKFERAIAVYAWNKVSERQQSAILAADSSTPEDDSKDSTAIIDGMLDLARTKREFVREGFLAMWIMGIVEHLPVDAIRLFRIYITLQKLRSESGTTYTRNSSGASTASGGREMKDTLTGNNVHANMFSRGDFREQEFLRFGFPDSLLTSLPCTYDHAVTDLEAVVDFLAIAKPRAREDVTHALFSLVMEKIISTYSTEHDLGDPGGQEGRVVVAATGMKPIDVDVTIGEEYLKNSAEIRELCQERAKAQRKDTGDMDTVSIDYVQFGCLSGICRIDYPDKSEAAEGAVHYM